DFPFRLLARADFDLAGCVFLARAAGSGFASSAHIRNPPANALALLPARVPSGNSLRYFTLPPPSTTSSGSSAATSRLTTSLTSLRHFFFPWLSRPRSPT